MVASEIASTVSVDLAWTGDFLGSNAPRAG
jgi:hypothetical protein